VSGRQVTSESVRAAFPEWEVAPAADGMWAARLTTALTDKPASVVAGATLGDLVDALNAFLAYGTQ
jgi:hypothetical protein